MVWTSWLAWLLGAFAAGSVPFAVLIGRARGVDIRRHGSGNPGATNLGRAAGKKWGLLCFGLDVGKGLGPTLAYGTLLPAAALSGPDAARWVAVGIAAVAGHMFSPLLGFRGGKGVATGLGAALGLFPVVTVPAGLAFVAWFVTAKLSGYVGLASVVAAGLLPPLTAVSGWGFGLGGAATAVFTALTAVLSGLVIFRHRGNLARLRAGEEPRARWTGRA